MRLELVVLVIAAYGLGARASEKAVPPPAASQPASKVKGVGVEEFDKLRVNKANVVLDVRTPEEFKVGHVPGAVNIDVKSSDFDKKVGELDKSKTYLVHCGAGVRSARACKSLEALGFTHLYDLRPGFKAWQQAGKPVEK